MILVTGASGYLGRRVTAAAAVRAPVTGTVLTAVAPSDAETRWGAAQQRDVRFVRLDLTDPGAVDLLVREIAPATVIHTAAANPGVPPEAFDPVNRVGSDLIARAAAGVGARLVHVSTDVVHDGRAAPYADDAEANPLFDYARSKADAERAVQNADPGAAVVRTSLIYGLDRMDTGTATFAARLDRGEPVQLFDDVLRQPVHVDALAAALVALALDHPGEAGMINVAGDQVLSRDRFGRRMLDHWNVPGRERVEAVSATDLGLSIPIDLRLRLDRARALGLPLSGVDQVLAGDRMGR